MQPRQLTFAFADNPQGRKDARPGDVSPGRAYLLHTAEGRTAKRSIAPATDTSRLLDEVAQPSNLAAALLNVARNKGAPGVDGRSIEEVVKESRRLLPKLARALLERSYQPGDIRRVWIPKPGGGQRGLGIPNVVDRWVQQALHQILEPVFEPTFHRSSHGFRPNRGAHTAIAEVKEVIESGYGVIVDMDISKFFDHVNHQRLLARLGQRIADRRILDLIRRMLKAAVVMPDGTRVLTQEGTPQGGPLSPLLSNVVLDELDVELDRRGHRFVRYADDCNIFVRSERAGQRVLDSTRRFIERRLRLKLNDDKSGVRKPEEVQFLGFCFRCDGSGTAEVHLSKRTRMRLATRIRELTPRLFGQSLKKCFESCNRYLKGWFAYFRICAKGALRDLGNFDAHLRRRIRAIIVRQKKRPRHLFRHLVARGVSVRMAAKTAHNRGGYWFKSHCTGMERAYPIRWFAERLVSLKTEWERRDRLLAQASEQRLLFPS